MAIRSSGLTNVPIVEVSDAIGYIPKPNQSGRFLHLNHWYFNNLSMALATDWDPTLGPNLLLIGNSIVMGTNPLDQTEKIGPLLQNRLGRRYQIWPIGGPGWTNLNETAYLELHPQVRQAATSYVWFYMSGGLSGLSTWRGQYIFPDHAPIVASWYVLRRYLLPKIYETGVTELPPLGTVSSSAADRFDAQLGLLDKTVDPASRFLLLYPTEAELARARSGESWLPELETVKKIAQRHHISVIDLAGDPRWQRSFYRDGVHPIADGDHVISEVIADHLAPN
jgi:hypothetical protein